MTDWASGSRERCRPRDPGLPLVNVRLAGTFDEVDVTVHRHSDMVLAGIGYEFHGNGNLTANRDRIAGVLVTSMVGMIRRLTQRYCQKSLFERARAFAVFVAALAAVMLLAGAQPAHAERRVALVIGNSAYQNAPALADPRQDAQAIAALFQKAGFDVVSAQYDAGGAALKRAIAQFEDEAARSDIAVVYYSGYGIALQGANYLVPVDAKPASDRDAAGEAISLERLAKSVEKAARLRLVILDASRGNPFAKTFKQQRGAASQSTERGLAEPDPKPGTLIAYAALAGTEADDGSAEHSTYSGALLRNLFVPGLDIRLAFGRVLVDVLRKSGNRQNPIVYGSLAGRNIALVPAPAERPGLDLEGEKTDYSVVEKIATAHAWEVFLVQHPTGFFSGVARQQLRLAEAEPPPPQQQQQQRVLPQQKPQPRDDSPPGLGAQQALGDQQAADCKVQEDRLNALEAKGAPASDLKAFEQSLTCDRLRPIVLAALDRANAVPETNTPGQVLAAQRELSRLGCFAGVADGALNAATRAAIARYLEKRGVTAQPDLAITDGFVLELQKQSGRICPVVCPPGNVADGDRCVSATVRRRDNTSTGDSGNRTRSERSAAAPKPVDRGGAAPAPARSGPAIGVGF
jgi:Caspase domain